MKKQLFLGLLAQFLFVGIYAQNSGTFSGSYSGCPCIHSFTSSGYGTYVFTGNYNGGSPGAPGVEAYIEQPNYYGIGGALSGTGYTMGFETNCVEVGQIIKVEVSPSPGQNYTLNYVFHPATYNIPDIEPNNTYSQAINTLENNVYEGYFDHPGKLNHDDTDWYKFTLPPTDGSLYITVRNSYSGAGDEVSFALFDADNLSQFILGSSMFYHNGGNTRSYYDFHGSGSDFAIRLGGACNSYQLIWKVENASGVINIDLNNSIELFPNPASENIKIEANNNLIVKDLEIYNITGKLIKKTALDSQNSISINSLNNGVYIVKLYTEYGVVTKKIIKSE